MGVSKVHWSLFSSNTVLIYISGLDEYVVYCRPTFGAECTTVTFVSSNGKRATAETSYLTPEVLARPNLKVATNATAHRVLFDTHSESTPRAVGVEFVDRSGVKFVVKALKEVVVWFVLAHVNPNYRLTFWQCRSGPHSPRKPR